MNHVFQKLPEKASGANRKAGARVREMGIRNELSRHRGRSEKVAPRLLAKQAPSPLHPRIKCTHSAVPENGSVPSKTDGTPALCRRSPEWSGKGTGAEPSHRSHSPGEEAWGRGVGHQRFEAP